MDFLKGVLDLMWPSTAKEEEESLEVLAEAATLVNSRKRGRLDTYSPGRINTRPRNAMMMSLPIDLANLGIARMLQINGARFGVDEERSTLRVTFDSGKRQRRRRRRSNGRFQVPEEEEYPYLGPVVDELAEHIKSQGIHDVCALAALYPAGFWNAVYTVGTDLDELRETLFQ